MNLKGKNVLVTGTNGPIGKALVQALLQRGAAKVYSAAKTAVFDSDYGSAKVEAVKLDITAAGEVAAAVRRCPDVDLLINSAGINLGRSLSGTVGSNAAREEIEINFFGTLGMCLAFAPVLASRGGGVIVNTCSSAGLANLSLQGVYRVKLAARNVRVLRAYPGTVSPVPPAGVQADESVAVPTAIAEAILCGVQRDLPAIPFLEGFYRSSYLDEGDFRGLSTGLDAADNEAAQPTSAIHPDLPG